MDVEQLITISDYERLAQGRLTQNAWNYYATGAGGEQTLSENKKAFDRLRIRPHMLRGISKVDTKVEVLGEVLDLPICIAPVAMQRMAHPDGEVGTARAAQGFNTCMGLSMVSTASYEEVAESAPDVCLLMQLYAFKDRSLTLNMIRRAEKAGFRGIALTVDFPVEGQRNHHPPKLPDHLCMANFTGVTDAYSSTSGFAAYCEKNIESELSPDTIAWLKSVSDLPIFLKGILTAEDTKQAVDMGVQGIIVSNHGGRQLDGVPSTIESLPEVVAAADGKVDVFLDGGIRRGTDVFKAIALGAKAVFIGRPVLWGLAQGGEEGVRGVLRILKEEFERTMLLAGCANLSEIVRSMVVHKSYYWNIPNHKL